VIYFCANLVGRLAIGGGGWGCDKVYLHACNIQLLMNYDEVNILYRYYKSVLW